MNLGNTPRIASSSYTTTTVPGHQLMGGLGAVNVYGQQAAMGNALSTDDWNNLMAQRRFIQDTPTHPHPQEKATKKEIPMTTRRIVQVFIADTDENVPLDKSVLFTGEQKLTDATDQELFFEIDIKNILDKHNAYRITLVNKKVKERVENLEPVKIRDLKMVVVNVASF